LVIDFLLSEFQARGFGVDPRGLRYCMVSSNRGVIGNDLIFLFPEADRTPRLVVKIGRTPANRDAITNEYHWVDFFAARHKGLGLLPRMHFSGEWNGRGYFVQDMIEGVGLDSVLPQWGINRKTHDCVAQAVDFLADLQSGFDRDDPGRMKRVSSLFETHLALLDAEPRQKKRIRQAAEAVGLTPCFSQGDFWATNILLDAKTNNIKGVIDFEYASDTCYTHFDIFWLIINLSLFVRNNPLNGDLFLSYKQTFFTDDCLALEENLFSYYYNNINILMPRLYDLFIISILYGTYRGNMMFKHKTNIDNMCSKMLYWTIENEDRFNMK
jgi:hypothetical protein